MLLFRASSMLLATMAFSKFLEFSLYEREISNRFVFVFSSVILSNPFKNAKSIKLEALFG